MTKPRIFGKLRGLLSGGQIQLWAVLDIGTVEAKALVVLVEDDRASIVGVGREVHGQEPVRDGAIADTQALAGACEKALAMAEAVTETVVGDKLVADRAVIGIAGPLLKSTYITLSAPRVRPMTSISEGELTALLHRAERLALQQARGELAMEMATPAPDVGLVDAELVQVLVDGYRVSSPVRLQGKQLEVRVSNVFAPLDYLAAVSSVATTLELEATAVVAGSCLVGRVLGRGDGIIIDIGGACTDVVLHRGGGVERMGTLPIGGLAFTRQVARALGVPVAAAEEIKRSYSSGRLASSRAEEVHPAVVAGVRTWLDGVQTLLEEMAARDPLPPRIFLCGGGDALPDLGRATRSHPWARVLPFTRYPDIVLLQPNMVMGPVDRTGRLVGEAFVVPAALAAWAVQMTREEVALPQRALRSALHRMGLS